MDDLLMGQQIKKARQAKNLTQKQLASMLGVATGTIQQYELGKRQPRFEQLTAIADALGVNLFDWIVAAMAETYDPDGKLSLDAAIRQHYDITGSYVVIEVENDEDNSVNHLISSVARLNQEGFTKASVYIDDLAGNPKYQRTDPLKPLPEDEQEETSTTQEKPPEGQINPKDGQ